MNPEKLWQLELKRRIIKNEPVKYEVWKEWYELVWKLPTEIELVNRIEESVDGLPIEYLHY
jgi:hypothetical protein